VLCIVISQKVCVFTLFSHLHDSTSFWRLKVTIKIELKCNDAVDDTET